MLLVPHAACARPPRPAPSGAYDAAAPGGVGELYTLSLPYELRLAHLERQLAAGERAGAGTAAGARAAGSDPAAAGPQPCGRVCRRCRAPERRGGVRARGRRLGARRAAAGWEPKGRPSWARPRRRPRALLGRVPAARPRRRRGHGRCRGRRRGERGRAGAQHRPAAPRHALGARRALHSSPACGARCSRAVSKPPGQSIGETASGCAGAIVTALWDH